MLQFWGVQDSFLVKKRADTQDFHGKSLDFISETTRFRSMSPSFLRHAPLGVPCMFQGSLGPTMPSNLRSRDAVRVFHRKSLEFFHSTGPFYCGR